MWKDRMRSEGEGEGRVREKGEAARCMVENRGSGKMR